MADLAVVFHWPPPVMDSMSVAELMDWRALAELRTRAPENTRGRKR